MEKRVVVITGGASGIGWAAAEAFLHRGWSVVIADRELERVQERLQNRARNLVQRQDAVGHAEFRRLRHGAKTIGRGDQRFARHAASKNAEPAQLGRAFDEGGAEAMFDRFGGCRVAGAASTDHDEIETLRRAAAAVLSGHEIRR